MRICIAMEYHPDDLTGGSEIQVFGLARQFALAGHEVVYVCQRYNTSRALEEIIDGVRVLRVLHWHKVFRSLVGPRLFFTIRAMRPDIIYQRFASPLTGITESSARFLSIPFVWGCSEDETLERGYLLRRQDKFCGGPARRAKTLVLRINARVNQRLFYGGVRRAQVVVVQNNRQLDLLRRSFGRSGKIIPNGIVLPPPRDTAPPEPLVLWLNRIARRKNAEAFIDLAQSMRGGHPGVRFVLVGGRQEDGYMEEIRQLSTKVRNLELVGPVPRADVQNWLRQAWVFLLTSTAEGFPNVLLEAWAAGVPVVSLQVDPDNLIEREGLGLLAGTQEGLERDVRRLLGDAGLRERLGCASRTFVSDHFDLAKIAERYLTLFQELVEQQPNAEPR